ALAPEALAEREYAYVALGHLHKFQVPQVNAVYPGSLERLDFGDVEGDKAVVEVDLAAGAGSNGFLKRHIIPTRPMFDIALSCEGIGPAEVVDALEKETVSLSLEGALVQLRLDLIQRD